MRTSSVKLMLLGIGVLLFGILFPDTLQPLLLPSLTRGIMGPYRLFVVTLLDSTFAIAGIVLVLAGFFKKTS